MKNLRKRTKWLRFERSEVSVASDQGATFGVFDQAEPDRRMLVTVTQEREALLIIGVLAEFVARKREADHRSKTGAFDYELAELRSIGGQQAGEWAVKIENRGADAAGWSGRDQTRWLRIGPGVMQVLQAVLGKI